MGRLITLIRQFDLLVTPYEFNVSNNAKALTGLGGMLSLGIIALMLLYSVVLFMRSISTKQVYAGTQADDQINYALDQDSTVFALAISDNYGAQLSYSKNISQYITIAVQGIIQTRTQNVIGYQRTFNNLQAIHCPQNTINQFNFSAQSFSSLQQQNLICFQGNYTIAGQFFDPRFSYIKIMVKKCNNATSQNQCQSDANIISLINKGLNVDLFLQGAQIKQTLNTTDPAVHFAQDVYWKLTTATGNNEDIYLSPVIIDLKHESISNDIGTDNSLERIYNSSTLLRQERRQIPIDIATVDEMCTWYLRLSTTNDYYFVVETSWLLVFLTAISQASGLAFSFIGFAKIVYKWYITHKTFETIMNYVFRFNFNDSQQRNSLKPVGDQQRNKPTTLQDIYDTQLHYGFCSFILFEIYGIIKEIKCLRKCFMFKPMKSNKKQLMAQIAKKKIVQDLDLANIVKKLYEIDFLKLFLFNDDQLLLFNSFCQPVLYDQIINEKESIKELNRLKSRQQVTLQYAASSKVSPATKLSKISRFFIAQIEAKHPEELAKVFTQIKNQHDQKNNKLFEFLKYNKILNDLLETAYREDKGDDGNLLQLQHIQNHYNNEDRSSDAQIPEVDEEDLNSRQSQVNGGAQYYAPCSKDVQSEDENQVNNDASIQQIKIHIPQIKK